jgi:hypothetical protein
MRKPIKTTKTILKILFVLLILTLGISLIQIILGEEPYASKTPLTPTDTPQVSFNVDIPQKGLWQNYFYVLANAPPGTTCVLLYIPPAGESQEMSSVAYEDGQCKWRWKIEESQGKGNGRLIITIDGRSETHFFEIRSSF